MIPNSCAVSPSLNESAESEYDEKAMASALNGLNGPVWL